MPEPSLRKIDEIDFDDNFNIEGVFAINKTFDNPDRAFTFSLSGSYKEHHEFEILHESIVDSTSFGEEINHIELDLSYKHPFNEKSKIEFGYDGKFDNNSENMNFQVINY